MIIVEESVKLPAHFRIEKELREQLSNRAGHQRCVEGQGELLLVLHDVPKPGTARRDAIFFWKNYDGQWWQEKGPGLGGAGELLDRYVTALDQHAAMIDEADTAAEVFAILRHSGPLLRSSRNLVQALEQVLVIDGDDREIRALRDRSREVERAADLLNSDARVTLEFWQAQRAEEQSRSAERLGQIVFRLNLLAGFFLPVVALAGLFGMNVPLMGGAFWVILIAGLAVGVGLLWFARRKPAESLQTGLAKARRRGIAKVRAFMAAPPPE